MRVLDALASLGQWLLGRIRGLRQRLGGRLALPAPKPSWERTQKLPVDLQVQLEAFTPRDGVIRDTVHSAVRDYTDLCDVVAGPGANGSGDDLIDDAEFLADAETLLRDIVTRAADIQTLVEIAGERGADRPGREAAGEAVLQLRDDAKTLARAASFAIRWAADRSDEARAGLRECAASLREAS